MNDWTWVWALIWGLIPLTFIVTWGVRRVVPSTRGVSRAQLDALKQQLDTVDTRLTSVEKTLNDIP